MTCEEARQFLHGYIDNELDLALAMRIESHLKDCADCKNEVASAKLIKRAGANPALYSPASAAFRDKISQSLRSLEIEESRPEISFKPSLWKTRSIFAFCGLGAAALVAIACSVWIFSAKQDSHLQVAALLDSHLRSLQTNHLLDVESSDHHTVKPWFSGKLDFSPPVIDLAVEGFPLIGGRLDYLDQRKVAALVYHRNKHIINLFISPGECTASADSKDGFNLIRFQCNGMTCWAISDLNSAELRQFANLFTLQKPASTRS